MNDLLVVIDYPDGTQGRQLMQTTLSIDETRDSVAKDLTDENGDPTYADITVTEADPDNLPLVHHSTDEETTDDDK